eukprot:6318257-Alexandrium_andersonii.AAC.1
MRTAWLGTATRSRSAGGGSPRWTRPKLTSRRPRPTMGLSSWLRPSATPTCSATKWLPRRRPPSAQPGVRTRRTPPPA